MSKLRRCPGGKLLVGRKTPFILPTCRNLSVSECRAQDALWQFLIGANLFSGVDSQNPLLYYFTKSMRVLKENIKACDQWNSLRGDYEDIEKLVRTQRWHSAAAGMFRLYHVLNDVIARDEVPSYIVDQEYAGSWCDSCSWSIVAQGLFDCFYRCD